MAAAEKLRPVALRVKAQTHIWITPRPDEGLPIHWSSYLFPAGFRVHDIADETPKVGHEEAVEFLLSIRRDQRRTLSLQRDKDRVLAFILPIPFQPSWILETSQSFIRPTIKPAHRSLEFALCRGSSGFSIQLLQIEIAASDILPDDHNDQVKFR